MCNKPVPKTKTANPSCSSLVKLGETGTGEVRDERKGKWRPLANAHNFSLVKEPGDDCTARWTGFAYLQEVIMVTS